MSDEITVSRNDAEHRYDALLDGAVVGFSTFRLQPGQVVLRHTEIDPTYEGRGYGSQLVRGALTDIRARGELVVPVCPFVRNYIERHADFADLVAQAQ